MRLFNVTFVLETFTINTTVEAQDRNHAHSLGLELIATETGLNLIPIRYQIEIEEIY
jgi:hypothetical protein